jgi:hypothetical protein
MKTSKKGKKSARKPTKRGAKKTTKRGTAAKKRPGRRLRNEKAAPVLAARRPAKRKRAQGKILIHDQGTGVAGDSDVGRRAHEIALTEDHLLTEADRSEAVRELRGEEVPPVISEDSESVGSLSRDPSDPPVDRGHQVPTFEPDDENDASERLVNEGVEEADHDQRVAAQRRRAPD